MAFSPLARSRPSFFKVFFPHLSSQSLKIPPAFRERLGGKFPRTVSLRGPSGRIWLVELAESSEGLQFRNGWKEFVADHSIELGDFLVFQYGGGLHFSVMMFDSTACEKEVAFVARPCREDTLLIDESEEEEKVNIKGDSGPEAMSLSPRDYSGVYQKRKIEVFPNKGHEMREENALSSLNKVHKVIQGKQSRKHGWLSAQEALDNKCNFSNECNSIVNKANSKLQNGHVAKPSTYSGTSTPQCLNKKLDSFCRMGLSKKSTKVAERSKLMKSNQKCGELVCRIQKMPTLISQRRVVTTAEVMEALKRAKSFKSEYPLFHIVMQESYVYYGFFMNVPCSFIREYLPKVAQKMTLWDPNGKPWPVSFLLYRNRGSFSGGWGRFSFANNLEKHDVCVFELFKENHMKVHIFRVVDEITPLVRKSQCEHLA